MKKGHALFAVSALLTSQFAMANVVDSGAEIRELVETFRISIINKDKAVFSSLFFSDNIPFVAVFSDEMLSQKRQQKPNYPAVVDFGKFGPPVKMLSDDAEQEEKMWNIKVQTDGYLASVHFDYSDHENGKKKAFGTESWSLVKVDTEWKITSVSFTVTEVTD
ncbi:hypothetical protein [Neptunicella marina]|uniref:Nuclear transport factor 2 family protein n=1 Tax=Neptunicella marina TaxID=2125989 RepID=A0A8J6ISF3_9ALTE|nr:hypothetical protein [Neptunicella marina]MBC3765559.1 hypothetical protein [Neptunicella marina]